MAKPDYAFLKDEVENNSNLKTTGKFLTYVSLLTIAILMSGATIKEANTFLFKIIFTHPDALFQLLLLCLAFLLIKYHSVANEYHSRAIEVWAENAKTIKYLFDIDPDRTARGFVTNLHNKTRWEENEIPENTTGPVGWQLKPCLLINAKIEFKYMEQFCIDGEAFYEQQTDLESIWDRRQFQKSLRVQLIVLKLFIKSFTKSPIGLSIYQPYWVAFIASLLAVIKFINPV
ncbi:hypothetical protein L1D59_08470 [Pseudoalteromonas piscicida]|uniref:hypothetical protein n=1 Tax=Pseudoalteromonas piscicida TaxID=43662 RepID=UPI001EFCBC93|nr:hypothetical protein [Pseudoalteromonas piscicida]MCG9768642.1 hypothetical protein [Pseudoalteromonas piscicida]